MARTLKPTCAPRIFTFDGGASNFDIVFRERAGESLGRIDNGVTLPMPGVHNVLNSLPAVIVAKRLGASDGADPRWGLRNLQRRQTALHTLSVTWNGVNDH